MEDTVEVYWPTCLYYGSSYWVGNRYIEAFEDIEEEECSLACILGVLLHTDHAYIPKGVWEVQFTLLTTKYSEIYNN